MSMFFPTFDCVCGCQINTRETMEIDQCFCQQQSKQHQKVPFVSQKLSQMKALQVDCMHETQTPHNEITSNLSR